MTAVSQDSRSKTILVVDDMPLCRESVTEVLQRHGFRVVAEANGGDALMALQMERPDLVLLDQMMPGMDGLVVLETIRRNPEWRNLPVILLTDLADKDRVHRAAALGIQSYLVKANFSVEELLSRIEKYIGAGTHADAPAPTARAPATQLPRIAASPPASLPPRKITADVRDRLRRQLQLQPMPAVLNHVIALTNSNCSSIDEVADALRMDQALALKVMGVANSSLYSTGSRAKTLKDAAKRLGLTSIRNAVAVVLAIEHYRDAQAGGLSTQRFWEHSLATAAVAQMIGETLGAPQAEELFLAGLLHDIGRMSLSSIFPEDYRAVLAFARERNVDLSVPEREVFGLTHMDVTKENLTQLKLSEAVVEAAALHGHSAQEIEHKTRNAQGALIVALANRIAHAVALGDSGNPMLLETDEHAAALGLGGPTLGPIARASVAKVGDTELFFASHGTLQLCPPMAVELAKTVGGAIRLIVLAHDAPNDAISLFFEQLGWLDSKQPELAILWASSEREMTKRAAQLERHEMTTGTRLGVVLGSPDGTVTLPPYALHGKSHCSITIPGQYNRLLEAIANVHDSLAASRPG